jgi:hypothetical protein
MRSRGRRVVLAPFVVGVLVVVSCGGEPAEEQAPDTVPGRDSVVVPTAPQMSPLDSAARAVLAFLKGEPSTIILADSVELYVGKEAGGTRTVYPRANLRHPSLWVARSSRGNYRFTPPATLGKLTVKRGTHFICTERKLAESFPELAKRPHVGVRLESDIGESCLQSWNVTFVFDDSLRPRLVAAVYDQFEW